MDLPPCWLVFATWGRPGCTERGAAVLPRAEKKCWFCDTFRVVEGAAGRPLAEKLSRLGVTGSLPVVKCAF
jgi:hypothetical protein